MTEHIQRLKQRRGVLRASTTKLLKIIEEETGKDNVSCDRLRELLSMLSSKQHDLLDLNREIETEIPMDELQADLIKSVDYQDNVNLWKARATRLIEREEAAKRERARLSDLYDECEVQIRGLESLGVVSDTYGGLLCPILLQMIPDDLALAYTRKTEAGQELNVLGLTLKLHTFGSSSPAAMQHSIVKLVLQNLCNRELNIEIEAVETPHVSCAVMQVPGEQIRRQLEQKGLPSADVSGSSGEDLELSVLIGADYYWKMVSGRVERLSESLVAIETIFGWTMQGPVPMSSMSEASCMKICIEEATQVSNQLRAFWELESLGISSKEEERPDNTAAQQNFDSSVRYSQGRYEVELPWRQDAPELPDNLRIAQKRFEGLKKRLKADVTLFKRYSEVIQDYIQQGICEDIPDTNHTAGTENSTVKYYLPHHAVVREDKATTKLRVVFDASSHENSYPSLNDCLLTGPNLNPDLLTVLVRFRLYPIAFMADITKAFLQISVADKDRDALRFLWLTGPPDAEDTKSRTLRMARVVFGVSSSPFLLAATIRNHLEKHKTSHPQAVNTLKDSLYVDDFIASSSDVEDAYALTKYAKEILSTAGMNLCKWTTNSAELKAKWLKEGFDFTLEPEAHGCVLKVLGLVWRPETDDFVFNFKHLMDIFKGRENTKRSVLRSSAKVFLTPFTIRVKCLFQDMWQRGISWDEELPDDLAQAWQQWCVELLQLHQIAIPRWYGTEKMQNGQGQVLHVFSDASERAYGAAAYLQGQTAEGKTVSRLIMSKSRVAPIKKLTLPRLELMGALIAARLGNKLLKALNMHTSQICMWSDSMIVIQWIRSSAQRWKQFVANRVTEIQSLTPPEVWSHCSGKLNPADLTTRGQPASKLKEEELWWSGPPFLSSAKQPELSNEGLCEEEIQAELKSSHVTIQLSNTENAPPDPLIKLENYSKLRTVLRVTAWIKRFIHNCHSKEKRRGELTAEEVAEAERHWILEAQNQSFQREISEIKAGRDVHKDSKIRDLKPLLDENGLVCVGGRLQHSDLSFSEQHPWILPSNHRLSEMLIKHSHDQVMHSGMRDTLVQLREKYWIPRARQMVKGMIAACTTCKRFRAKAMQQITAPLPRDRITESPPFETVGVDFAGPLYVKTKSSTEKAYIALFTCAVTRAVHLELVSDLSTEKFLLAFKRFIARRGLCRVVYSDNARTFKRADQDLRALWKAIKEPEMLKYFSNKGIIWKYIAERAAWWGFFWERLVRSVKTCLRKIMGRASLSFEELSSLLAEVEATINSRPLTFVYSEPEEPQPLTPAHFLIGKRLSSLPPKPFHAAKHTFNSSREELTRRWKYRQRLLSDFWIRWKREYLLELRSAHTRNTPRPTPLKEGDLVLIGDDKMPRQIWKTGVVKELFMGRDGLVRSCAVRTTDRTILRRPVQLLYPLETV
ncbi:Pro-Pol polyprotein [Merluccius polli]|uniref:Pro-Pol polyprotein n=1 Tax=Merluccius polli TaxID=89951 RepID=A0AA47MD24_MERPO|nr:Pro-Pol polyprotein [Merluccius polli]